MPALELYAPEKGRYSRWILGVSAMLLAGYGTHSLYYSFPEGMRAAVFGWKPLGDEFPISWGLIISVSIFVAFSLGTWLAINHQKLVDFLHETEVEMTKVSWASKDEVLRSSLVVVVTTIILAVWVYMADILLAGVRTVFGG
ncbi:preprotein translocase subunit SecE [Planctomycetota bacterium]